MAEKRHKEDVSRAKPCLICGRTDGDFRLIDADGFVTHWCFRGPDNDIAGFVHTGQNQNKVALYQIYMTQSDYDNQRALEKERWIAEKDRIDPGWRERWKEEQRRKNPNWRPCKPKAKPKAAVIHPVEQKEYVAHPELNRVASVERRNEVYKAFLSLLKVESKHFNKLRAEWGDETIRRIDRWGIRSLPPIDFYRFKSREKYISLSRKNIMEQLVKRVGPPEYVPGFYEVNGTWTCTGLSGIVYPLYDLKGRIAYLRIANDYPDVRGEYNGREVTFSHKWTSGGEHLWTFLNDEKKEVFPASLKLKPEGIPYGKTANKYLNFNSCSEATYEKDNVVYTYNEKSKGARAGSHPGLFATKGDSYRIVDATEGEKKSIINNEITHHPTICLPGVGCWGMLFDANEGVDGKSWFDVLVERGMKQINILYDADKYENERVMNAEQSFVSELLKYPQILVCVGEWSTAWEEKGLDDILLSGIMPRYIPVQIAQV